MSVSNQTVKTLYDANGSTDTFAVPFAYIADDGSSFVKVYTYDEATGVATLKTITTHYTLSPNNANPTNVVFVTAPADGLKVLITRESYFEQDTEYQDEVPFPATTHETALDKLFLMIQELKADMARTLKFNVTNSTTSTAELRKLSTAGALLQINDDNNAIEEGPTYQDILDAEIAAEAAAAAAASSASAASASASAAASSATDAQTAENNAETAETNAETAATAAAASAAAAAVSAGAAAASEVVVGTLPSPEEITGAGGIAAPTSTADHLMYVSSDGGAVNISANPQIAAGTREGQRYTFIGSSDSATLTLDHSDGLVMNGSYTLVQFSAIQFRWDDQNNLWIETYRNGI